MKLRVFPSILEGTVKAPSSKSYTHRAIVLSSLAEGESKVECPLLAEDTWATINACKELGATVKKEETTLKISGNENPMTPQNVIDVENSGTTLRLMTSVSSLIPNGYTILSGDVSIRQRPMQPLLDAMHRLGVECWSTRLNGLPPIIVKGGGISGGEVEIDGKISSQFISGILLASARAENKVKIMIRGRQVSKPYIEMTIATMKHFGGDVKTYNDNIYMIQPKQHYQPRNFKVPGDFSSASLMLAFGILSGGKVTVENLELNLPQGDQRIVELLRTLGVSVEVNWSGGFVSASGGIAFRGGTFDLSDTPDLLPVIAVLALKAEGKVRIEGVEHTRFKESDRIAVISRELRRIGCEVDEFRTGLIVEARRELKGGNLDAHGDHRLFMAFVAAAQSTGKECVVDGLESVAVSYPSFLEDLRSIGCEFEVIEE